MTGRCVGRHFHCFLNQPEFSMTLIEPHLHATIAGGGAPRDGAPPEGYSVVPTHAPTPTCPVWRPPPES